MCFSPTASFVSAGFTGTIGIIALARATGPREWPLASVPIFFATQQSIEGLLWLNLPSDPASALAIDLPLLFLFFAEVFWPIYVPIAVLLVEPSARRRFLMSFCLAVGLCIGLYLLWWILTHTHSASIVDDHNRLLARSERHSNALGLAYLAATGLPGMLSPRRTLFVLGSIIMIGSAIHSLRLSTGRHSFRFGVFLCRRGERFGYLII